jgi:uncharacterized protein with GYD domain
MMTFICYLNFTGEGIKAIKDMAERYAANKALVQKLGGREICTYITTGQYDAVEVLEMPTAEAMAKFSATLGARGFVRTTTVHAFTPEEFGKLTADIRYAK